MQERKDLSSTRLIQFINKANAKSIVDLNLEENNKVPRSF